LALTSGLAASCVGVVVFGVSAGFANKEFKAATLSSCTPD
jgi:hypothetical protein